MTLTVELLPAVTPTVTLTQPESNFSVSLSLVQIGPKGDVGDVNPANVTYAAACAASATAASTSASAASTSATNAAASATQSASSAASAAAIVTGVSSNRPSVRPSLLLDFQYTKQLDPRVTFSRPTTATYYDGKTVAKAEENLLTYSQEFDNAAWGKTSTTVAANSVAAPDGTTTADKFIDSANYAFFQMVNTVTVSSGAVYSFSVYAKAGEHSYIQLAGQAAPWANMFANFNLSTGFVGVCTGFTASIQAVGNGWYRCSVIGTALASGIGGLVFILTNNTDSTTRAPIYTGTGTGVYLWGAQLEQRSTVTAYTPTTTAPITNYIPALQTAAANVARFDHDPVTGESKGLLIEEQRTNLLTYSEQFDNSWGLQNTSVSPNVAVAPDGTATADKIVPNTTNAPHAVFKTSYSVSSAFTGTIYAKAAGYNWLVVSTDIGGANGVIYFNLQTGVVGTVASGFSASITPVGNGWYRCSVVRTSPTTASGGIAFYPSTADNTFSFAGDGYSGIYIWGAQLEAGAFPTSYIPTVASQVTRSADSASMTGANFSSWYRADEGTIYMNAVVNVDTGLVAVNLNAGSYNNQLSVSRDSSLDRWLIDIWSGSTRQALLNMQSNSAVVGADSKVTVSYKVNDFSAVANAGTPISDTVGATPVGVDRLAIGYDNISNNSYLNGTIKRIAYYPKRLSNTELQGLTS